MASFTQDELKDILGGMVICEGSQERFPDVSIDSRTIEKGGIFIAIRGACHDGHDFIAKAVRQGAQALIVSKNIRVKDKSIFILRVKDTTKALGQLAQAHRTRFNIPIIAITGSAGKTTTKELVAAALKARYRVLKNEGSFNNQWGVPLTLLRLSARYDAAVVEVGTNHPGEIDYLSAVIRPTVAVLTNIGESHLKGFKTVRNVFYEKRSIIEHLMPGGTFIFNGDDPFLASLKRLKCRHYSYRMNKKADFYASGIVMNKQARMCFKINGRYKVCLKTPVMENVSNALAAVACTRLLRIPFQDICDALGKVVFDNHRQQIERVKGLTIINDSYNSNPISFRSACSTLINFPNQGKRVLVSGDMLELGHKSKVLHQDAGRRVSSLNIDRVFAFGSMMKYFADHLKRSKPIPQVTFCKTMARLNRELLRYVEKGDVILVKGSRGMRMERVVEFLQKNVS